MGLAIAGTTDACRFAAVYLQNLGIRILPLGDHSVNELLLDVPSFRSDSLLRDGSEASCLWEHLSPGCSVYGGNLNKNIPEILNPVDFLTDPLYTAKNAAITARCAVTILKEKLTQNLTGLPILIIGWGRIGKCLGKQLQNQGCDVTIAARKITDRAIMEALDYRTDDTSLMKDSLDHFHAVINTAPAAILKPEDFFNSKAVKIDLASQKGLPGDDVIWARGLPGVYAADESGTLIAETYLRLRKGDPLWK